MSADPSNEKSTFAPRRRFRLTTMVIVVCALAALGLGGIGLYQRYFGEPKRFAVVDAGVLYRSAQPKPAQIGYVIQEYGVKTIVVVRDGISKAVPDEAAYAERHGAKMVYIPVVSRATVPDDQIESFFRVVDDPARRPVLVHCSAGRHRTGLMCALYRIERQGWTVDRALAEMASFGFNTESQSAVYQQLKAYKPGRFALGVAAGRADAGGGEGH